MPKKNKIVSIVTKTKNPSGYEQEFMKMDGIQNKELGRKQRFAAQKKLTDAQEYLKETQYHADLTVMYEFNPKHATCAYNQQMEYTPVQVLVKDAIKKLHDDKNVLLQVWDKKGRKTFQEKLLNEVNQWAICFEYFIFKSNDPQDQQGKKEFFKIVNLDDNNYTILMEDFLKDVNFQYFVFNENKFYAADQNCVKIVPLILSKARGANTSKDHLVKRFIDESMVATIQLYHEPSRLFNKVHGLSLTNDGSSKNIIEILNQNKMAATLTQDQIKDVKKAFEQMIYNKEKKVTQKDIAKLLKNHRLDSNGEVVDEILKSVSSYGKRLVHVYIEVPDQNKISINEIEVEDQNLPPYFNNQYKLVEFREFISDRELKYQGDEIEEYQFIYTENNTHVAVAKRASGQFDIYYNGNQIDDGIAPESKIPSYITSFQVTYDRIIFEQINYIVEDKSAKKNRIEVDKEKYDSEIDKRKRTMTSFVTLEHGKPFLNKRQNQGNSLSTRLFFSEMIKHSCKLFSAIVIIEANVFVAHGRYLSQFYLDEGKDQSFKLNEKGHKNFKSYIRMLFKFYKIDQKTNQKQFSIGIFLENGEFHVLQNENTADYRSWILERDQDPSNYQPLGIPGDVFSHSEDPDQYKCHLFLSLQNKQDDLESHSKWLHEKFYCDHAQHGHNQNDQIQKNLNQAQDNVKQIRQLRKDQQQVRAYIFTNKLIDITEKLTNERMEIKLQDGDRMVGMYEGTYEGALIEGTKIPHFVYYEKNDTRIHLLKAHFPKDKQSGAKRPKKEQKMMKKAADEMGIKLDKYKDLIGLDPDPVTIERVDKMRLNPKELLEQHFDKNYYKNELWWRDTIPEHFEIISAVITKKYFLVFSKYNCYRVEKNQNGIFNKKNTQVIPDLRWSAFFIANTQHTYLLSDKVSNGQVGFSYFDLTKFFDENFESGEKYVDQRTWLEYAQVGANSCIDYGQKIERLGFIKSYSQICLIPNLHLNQVTLIGQQQIQNYVAVNHDKDAFYAMSNHEEPTELDKNMIYKYTLLTTWDMLTGKRTCMKQFYQESPRNYFVGYERFKTIDNGQEIDVYKWGYHPWTLLKKIEHEKEYAHLIEQNYDHKLLTEKFTNQVVYHKSKNDHKKFHKFKLIRLKNHKTIETVMVFEHQVYDSFQQLYFSSRGNPDKPTVEYMIEWLKDDRVLLYKAQQTREVKAGKDRYKDVQGSESKIKEESQMKQAKEKDADTERPTVEWKLLRRMKFLDSQFGCKDFLEQVSPDFTKFIAIDNNYRNYYIRDMFTEAVLFNIPPYIMCWELNPAEYIHKFKWVSDDMFKVINPEGMEKIVGINTHVDFRQENFNQTHNYDHNEESNRNYYFNRKALPVFNVIDRLIRKNQSYKSAYYMKDTEFRHQNKSIYEFLFTIDYEASYTITKKFFTDLSFSYVSWRSIEQLESGQLKISDLDHDAIKKINLTILPKCQTAFHKLYEKSEIIETLYDNAVQVVDNEKKVKYSIPYVVSQEDPPQDPIKLCIHNNTLKTLNTIVQNLSYQGIDHHSRAISNYMPSLLNLRVPYFVDYMKSRNQQTQDLKVYKREEIKTDRKTPGIMVSDMWEKKKLIRQTLFTSSDHGNSENRKGQEIKVQYIDVAQIHEFSDLGLKFMESMANTDDLELFELDITKKIIEFQWPIIRQQIIYYLFIPFVSFLTAMVVFTTFLLHGRVNGEESNWIENMIINEVLVVIALYFLRLEFMQMKNDGLRNYFSSFWNIVDIIPITIIITIFTIRSYGIMSNMDHESEEGKKNREVYACLFSFATLLLWFKFLYFLRIFENFGFLIRAIIQVMIDMQFFIVILLLVTIAFGDSFKVMNVANSEDQGFISEKISPDFGNFLKSMFYSYLIGLGEFNAEEGDFGQVGVIYCQILFVMSTVMTTIIMLNLFIAIISESFDKINQNKMTASFREKATLIYENQFLLSPDQKSSWCQKGKYLIYVKLMHQSNDSANPDAQTQDMIVQRTDKLDLKMQTLNNGQRTQIKNLQQEITVIKNLTMTADEERKEDKKNATHKVKPIQQLDHQYNQPLTKFVITNQNAQVASLDEQAKNDILVNVYDAMSESEAQSYTFSKAQSSNKIEVNLNLAVTIKGFGIKCSKDMFPKTMALLSCLDQKDPMNLISVKNFEFSGPHQQKVFVLKQTEVQKLIFDFGANHDNVSIGQIMLYI